MFLSAPKFGNDDDYVDKIALEIHQRVKEVITSFKNYHGTHYLTDGTVSPAPGRDKKRPTGVLKSVSKVDPMTTYNHLLNQKFLPRFLEGENKEIFAAYLKTWADLSIH